MKKVLKWIGITFVGLVVIGFTIDALKSPEQKAAEVAAREQQQAKQDEDKRENARQEMAVMSAISANDIVSAYGENTVAADQKFKDKKFKISGIVSDINTDLMGDPYITLSGGGNQFMEPHFGFEKSEAAQLANLKKGAMVTLVCIGKGDVAKTPMSDSCLLVDDVDAAANKMVTTQTQLVEPTAEVGLPEEAVATEHTAEIRLPEEDVATEPVSTSEPREQMIFSPSFDCAKASTFSEKAICSDTLLGKLDGALSENYKSMLASNIGEEARSDLKTTQRKWLTERNKCTSNQCLANVYRKRVDEVCDQTVISGVIGSCTNSDDII